MQAPNHLPLTHKVTPAPWTHFKTELPFPPRRTAPAAAMPLDLYYCITSPFCRSVLLTARTLGVELNLKEVDIWQGEQFKAEYLALNPEHTVPTLVDGDLVLCER